MKQYLQLSIILFLITSCRLSAQGQPEVETSNPRYYIDVHHFAPGTVTFQGVADAHAKDLATQSKHGVNFIKYWVDEKNGNVYCLSSATDSNHIVQTHREAHGLLPQEIYQVSEGAAAEAKQGNDYFLDVHQFGANKVKAADVEKAHQKDLAVQEKHGVHFINYWVDEKKGLVFCLSQASNSSKVIKTHEEAHGLLPSTVSGVKEGQ